MKSKLQYRDPRNLRKLNNEKLREILKDLNIELAVFRSTKYGYPNPMLPAGKTQGKH